MDDMDFYLSRCVKNWAAAKQPPAGGRARLLMAASSPPIQRDRQLVRFFTYLRVIFLVGQEIYPQREIHLGPITQSRAWSFHLASNWRWAI